MAAVKGNQYAKGNKGGKGAPSVTDRTLSAEVRRLALKEMKAILMRPEMDSLKEQVILKLASSVLPRLNEHSGEGGAPIKLIFDPVFNESATS